MNSLTEPKTLASIFVMSVLTGFALWPMVQAVSPAPDGGYPGGNTAEGQSALLSLTTGTFNTAVGLFSLISNTDASFNTAVGAAKLLSNTIGGSNTATGFPLAVFSPPMLFLRSELGLKARDRIREEQNRLTERTKTTKEASIRKADDHQLNTNTRSIQIHENTNSNFN